jgi:hypothetical protein
MSGEYVDDGDGSRTHDDSVLSEKAEQGIESCARILIGTGWHWSAIMPSASVAAAEIGRMFILQRTAHYLG